MSLFSLLQFFCVFGKESWAFSKAYKGTSCLPNWIIKPWPNISQAPWPLGFPVNDSEIFGRIGHKVYAQESWKLRQISLARCVGDPWSYIPLSVTSHQLFFTGSFSSPFLIKLNLCCYWDLSHSNQAETRLDLPSALPDIPSPFLCASWCCALCHPHTLAQLISHFIFIPGCYDHIILRKCSGKAKLCSKTAMLLHCVISDTV